MNRRLDFLTPEFQPGVNLTVRNGSKWADARPGDLLDMYKTGGAQPFGCGAGLNNQPPQKYSRGWGAQWRYALCLARARAGSAAMTLKAATATTIHLNFISISCCATLPTRKSPG